MAVQAIRSEAMASEARPEPRRASATARMLAPFGLALAALVVAIVIAGSVGGPDGESADGGRGDRQERVKPRLTEDNYTVQPGDTLSGIATESGVDVDRLLQLNPDLDPQNLASGQQIKLR
jgi:hypothetical protein